MADQLDIAQKLEAHYRSLALGKLQRPRGCTDIETVMQCIDCDEEIPKARRLALPGCTRCIDCQQEWETENR